MTCMANCALWQPLLLASLLVAGSNIYGQIRPEVTPPKKPSETKSVKTPEAKKSTSSKSEQQHEPTPGSVRVNPKDGLKYVWIPPGTFMMGSSPGDSECKDDEKPSHLVRLPTGFWMGQTEITVGAIKRFVRQTGGSMPVEYTFSGESVNPQWANDRMPMRDVAWDSAGDYCKWIGGRLPTEAEWEYAARAGNTNSRYGPVDEIAWYVNNSGLERLDIYVKNPFLEVDGFFDRLKANANSVHEVARKRPNGLGLYDIIGNVPESVLDLYNEHYYEHSEELSSEWNGGGERQTRGGGAFSYASEVRVSARDRFGSIPMGFRCVWVD